MKVCMIAILVVAVAFSGCTSLDKSPVLYATANITENETGVFLEEVDVKMEMVTPLKVPRSDQNAKPPFMSILGYANTNIISYRAAIEYHGTGTYLFTIPIIEDSAPQYNDTMMFQIRFFNETSDINRAYFYKKWEWNNSDSDL